MTSDGDTATVCAGPVLAGLIAERRRRTEDVRPATIADVRRMIAAAHADQSSTHNRQHR